MTFSRKKGDTPQMWAFCKFPTEIIKNIRNGKCKLCPYPTFCYLLILVTEQYFFIWSACVYRKCASITVSESTHGTIKIQVLYNIINMYVCVFAGIFTAYWRSCLKLRAELYIYT
jgi:hypothetical protein